MEKTIPWLEAIMTVVFDLEEGQLPGVIIPDTFGTEKDRKTISYNSFPDSFTFNLEGQMLYSFYLRKETQEEQPDLLHCFACFSQRKDPSNPRGYFQKSVVFLTKIKLYSFFKQLFADIAEDYFRTGDDEMLRQVYITMSTKWPQPEYISDVQQVELLGRKYEIKSEKENSYKHRFSADTYFNHSPVKSEPISREDPEEEGLNRRKISEPVEASKQVQHDFTLAETTPKGTQKPGLCDDFKEINIFRILGRQPSCLVFKMWEIMMLNESLLILADSPIVCSELVYALQSIITPFQSSCEVYPYITVFDKEVDLIRKGYPKSRDGILIGGTNPLFTKNFEGFPNILRLDKEFEESIIKKNLIMKSVKTSSFLKSEVPKRAKGESLVKKFLTKDVTSEGNEINNAILRKKLEKLSFGIAGLISTYFSNQKNDLKFFDGVQFLKQVKEMNIADLSDYFGGKAELLKFIGDFILTKNFQNYMVKYFNVHLIPNKAMI